LASLVVPFLITYGLADIQTRMPFNVFMHLMDAGMPESTIALNCLKEQLNRK
jgi:hypothetical protein